MPDRAGRRAPLAPEPTFLFAGIAWGLALALLLGTSAASGASSAGGSAAILFLCLFAGLAHAGGAGALAGLLVRLWPLRTRPGVGASILAALGAVGYAWLSLSALKFSRVGAHLRYEDLWFLVHGAGQLGGETTSAERGVLLAAAALPLSLFLALLVSFRLLRGRLPRWRLGEAAALGIAGLAGMGAVALGHGDARAFAATRLPLGAALLPAPAPAGSASTGPGRAERRPIVAYRPRPPAPPVNVVVLMLESIPWQRLFGPLARPESTPRLLELARESVVFDRAYATSTHSDYAQTSILASLHPRKLPGHDYFRDLAYPRTLFWDPLAALGYRTAVFSCQNERWGNMIAFLETPGLELLRHAPDWPDAPRRGEGAESKVFEATPLRAFLGWLDERPGAPFAVYLNFQATHYPYVVPDGYPERYTPAAIDFATTFLSYPAEKIPVMENRFHNALAYVDEQAGVLLSELSRRGLLESTALLVVSDHGEAFYEHGLPTHGTTLLEEQARTAMLLRLPGVAPRRIAAPVSVLDAVPTIYRALGLPPHGNFQGRDDVLEAGYDGASRPLLLTIQGMTREDGLVTGDWKFIVNWDRRERALFHLASDPMERSNLVAARPDELARHDAVLARLLESQLGYYRQRGWESGSYPPPLP